MVVQTMLLILVHSILNGTEPYAFVSSISKEHCMWKVDATRTETKLEFSIYISKYLSIKVYK